MAYPAGTYYPVVLDCSTFTTILLAMVFCFGFYFFFFWTKYNIEGPFQGAFDPLSPFSKGRELSS